MKKPWSFIKWRLTGNYLISLAVKDLPSLESLMNELDEKKIKYVKFYELDINEVTAITIVPSEEANKATANLSLANKKTGSKDKYHI